MDAENLTNKEANKEAEPEVKLTKHGRPLGTPAEELSIHTARFLGGSLFALGVGVSVAAGVEHHDAKLAVIGGAFSFVLGWLGVEVGAEIPRHSSSPDRQS
jgi:putative Mn2+ efflux pump MntP